MSDPYAYQSGLAVKHRSEAEGLALAHNIPVQAVHNALSSSDRSEYPIVKAAMILGPLACYRDWEGAWRLHGELTTPRRIYLAAAAAKARKITNGR